MAFKQIRAPFGRIAEAVAKLTDDEKQRAAVKHGRGVGDDSVIQVWNHRKAMAKTIRIQEHSSPRSEWIPVVKLGDGEGY
jgi:hypothetical protein